MKSLFNAKKMLAILILVLAAADTILPVSAMEVTQGDVLNKVDGRYGASLDSVIGAKVETDLTNAVITNTQTNSVLNWNNLNTAPNQTLNFVMKDGQTSLNKVTGVGLSEFAGGINSEKGTLIISNPNGMIFENGSYINANALVLTTHLAEMQNGNLKLNASDKNKSIIFSGGNVVATDKIRFNIANDLSIVSSNIDVNNAEIVAKDTKFVTADGVTFFEINKGAIDYNLKKVITSEASDLGKVNINNSQIAVRDKNTGKISIVSKGDVNVNKTTLNGKLDVNSTLANGGNVTLDKVNSNDTVKVSGNKIAMYNSTVDNVDLNSKSDIKMQNVVATSDGFLSNIFAKNKVEVRSSKFHSIKAAAADITFTDTNLNNGSNVQATNNVTFNKSNKNNVISINNSTVVAGKDVNVNESVIKNSLVNATQNVNANNSTISNTEMNVGRNVYANGSKVANSNFKAENDIQVAGGEVSNTTLTATKDLKLGNAKLNKVKATGRYGFLENATLENGSDVTVDIVSANNVYNTNETVQGLKIKNSKLKSNTNNINLEKAVLENADVTASNGNIYLTTENVVSGNYNASGNFSAKSSSWKKALSFDNANIVAGGNVKLMSTPNFSNSTITTTGAKSVVDMQKANISNANINAFNIYGQGSTITDSILNVTNDIIVSNSAISNSVLTATKDLKLENTNLNNVKANGRYAFLNNATLENGSTLVASRLSSQGTNDYETGHIVYKKGMTVENLTIKDSTMKVGDDVYLKNAKLDNAKIETSAGKNLNIDTTENVKLVGVKIGGNLNITKAGNVEISNSKAEAGNQDIPSMTTKSPVTDYDRNKFNENYFETISGNYGNVYGKDSNLSNIVGSVNISNADNSLIINTIIGGDLEVSNIVGEANLVTSLVEGNYSIADRATMGDVNVYKSYINGDYTTAFDYQLVRNNDSTSANTVASALVGDINRKDYGNDVNTTFQRRFSPRGFAAQEDEITNMKNVTKSSVVKSENNKIKITKAFHAY